MNNKNYKYARLWWWDKRFDYNKGLFRAGFIAFMLYNILGPIIIEPHEEFDETGVLVIVHGIAYLLIVCIANVFYTLGYLTDICFNKNNSSLFRQNLFAVGYWFSVSLPIVLVLLIMCQFLFL
ncbi:hypothetical protein ACFQZX_13655 [Mucilaginibacter litoreus]|uniref:Succinate dehydrogenase / fumarate reductase membrane anchor subunit n=1 Tax=Mucilaginibacter litoreus TaxID=1048221 RepID=A0ABW3AUW8_9SPHI